jgi:hypothetical protein
LTGVLTLPLLFHVESEGTSEAAGLSVLAATGTGNLFVSGAGGGTSGYVLPCLGLLLGGIGGTEDAVSVIQVVDRSDEYP